MLGPHCRTSFSPVAVHGLLTVVASPVEEHGLWGTRASVFAARGFSSCGSWAQSTGSVAGVLGLSRSAAREILSDQGSNPCLPHLQPNSPLLSHQGNPSPLIFILSLATDTQTGSHFLFTNSAAPCSFSRLSPPGHVDGVWEALHSTPFLTQVFSEFMAAHSHVQRRALQRLVYWVPITHSSPPLPCQKDGLVWELHPKDFNLWVSGDLSKCGLEKTLESPLNSKEIQPANPKSNQP